MPTELKIRKVRSITVSGVQSGNHGDGKFARLLTVRSEDGHIYNITLISDRAEWLDLEESDSRRGRRHATGGTDARSARVRVPGRTAEVPAVALAAMPGG
jgi:hypothetical protein